MGETTEELRSREWSEAEFERDDEDRSDDDEVKRARLNCISFVGIDRIDEEVERRVQLYIEDKPEFIVTDGCTSRELTDKLSDEQKKAMKYFINIRGRIMYTNSVQMASSLKVAGMTKHIDVDEVHCKVMLNERCEDEAIASAVKSAIDDQMKNDKMQIFMYQLDDQEFNDERVQEAQDAERQCHEQDQYEIAWGDANDCELYPIKVRLARQAEMEFFKKMRVYKKVPKQKCRDMTGKEPIKVR